MCCRFMRASAWRPQIACCQARTEDDSKARRKQALAKHKFKTEIPVKRPLSRRPQLRGPRSFARICVHSRTLFMRHYFCPLIQGGTNASRCCGLIRLPAPRLATEPTQAHGAAARILSASPATPDGEPWLVISGPRHGRPVRYETATGVKNHARCRSDMTYPAARHRIRDCCCSHG